MTTTNIFGNITNNIGIKAANDMLESIFGNNTTEKILFFLQQYKQGYPSEIAKLFGIPLFSVQNQLQRLENGGIIVSKLYGKVRLYQFNPRYYFLNELQSLLQKALDALPKEELDKYYMRRARPRRTGKPL